MATFVRVTDSKKLNLEMVVSTYEDERSYLINMADRTNYRIVNCAEELALINQIKAWVSHVTLPQPG